MSRAALAQSTRPSIVAVVLASIAVLAVALFGLGIPAASAGDLGPAGSGSPARVRDAATARPEVGGDCVAGQPCGATAGTSVRRPSPEIRTSGAHGNCSMLYRGTTVRQICLDRPVVD